MPYNYTEVDGWDFEFPEEQENMITIKDHVGRDYTGDMRAHRGFVNEFMREKVRVMNQFIYYRFQREKGIDIIPVYLEWKPYTQTVLTHIRTDWLKAKIQSDLDFPAWLYKKGMHKKSKVAQTWIENRERKSASPSPWYKKMHEQFLEETKDNPRYKKIFDDASGVPILHLTEERGEKPTQGKKTFRGSESDLLVKERLGSATKPSSSWYRQFFVKPLKSDDFVKLCSFKNRHAVWGDDNMKQYLREDHGDGVTNIAKYTSIMKEVQDILFNDLKKVNFKKEWEKHEQIRNEDNEDKHGYYQSEHYFNQPSSEQNKAQQQVSFQPMFPNIKKLRDWFVSSGIMKTKKSHKFNADAYLDLKNNTQRMNFLDSAVFLIGLSIYKKNGGTYDLKSTIENARAQRGKSRGKDNRSEFRDETARQAAYLTRSLNRRRSTGRDVTDRANAEIYYKRKDKRKRRR